MTIYELKRIYDKPSTKDGFRVLVDRLWPRGISKEKANVDLWAKDIAPTNELRKFFNHEQEHYQEFIKRYNKELRANAYLKEFLSIISKHKHVTLLYGAKNTTMNQAVVLMNFLEKIQASS